MISRRTILSGAAALAVTAALPAALVADELTAEEARLLANVPDDMRDLFLFGLRSKKPNVRAMFVWLCEASDSDRKWFAVVFDRIDTLMRDASAWGRGVRGMSPQKAIAAGLITELDFYSTAYAPVTLDDWDELVAREPWDGDWLRELAS